MATVIVKTDTLIHIYSTATTGSGIGSLSKYTDTPHPGTNKLIEGFEWDFRNWPDDKELEAISYAPSIWDPSRDFILDEEFQSGIGDNADLLLLSVDKAEADNIEYWIPRIHHGYFYIQDEEWYLYSDDFQTQAFNQNQTYSGLQYVDLKYNRKPGIPIGVKRYKYDSLTGRYTIDLNLRKKIEFTGKKIAGEQQPTMTADNVIILSNVDQTKEEFILSDKFGTNPRVLLNKNYSEAVGGPLTLGGGGNVTSGSLDSLEIIGIGDGSAREFHAAYSPVDPSGIVEVYTWVNETQVTKWTRINGVSNFTPNGSKEFKFDERLGIVSFGTFTGDVTESGNGLIPPAGTKIGITYRKGLQVEYEPIDSRDWLLAPQADVNPLHNATEKGFIKLSTELIDVGSIELSADLPQQLGTGSFTIDAGNNTGEIIATVRDTQGQIIEGVEVFFEIEEPIVGTFTNGQIITSSITNTEGQASAYYAPPVSIDALGKATTNVSYNGGTNQTTIVVDGIAPPDTVSGVFLYKVMKEDSVLGIPESSKDVFYSNFFTEEKIAGTTATTTFEENRRTLHGLLKPTLYSSVDITTGAKIIVFGMDNNAINPHTGDQAPGTVYAPVIPLQANNVGSSTAPAMQLIYSGNLGVPGTGTDFKSYFTVGESVTTIRAYVVTKRTMGKVYSKPITLAIQVPDNANGVLIANSLADIQEHMFKRVKNVNIDYTDGDIMTFSGQLYPEYLQDRFPSGETYPDWFRRTRRVDTELLGMREYVFSGSLPARIPFGFKLKDSGITVASLLDAVTFLDLNDTLPSGYI